jgi:multidrug efflux system outer membrane protein
LTASLTACAVGPNYQPSPAVHPETSIRTAPTADSTRVFFDSLAAARRSDSGVVQSRRLPEVRLESGAIAGTAWLDILHDTVLVQLVDKAMRQNRNVQTAVARIREYRAEAGVARAPLYPGVSANGSVSTQQIVFAGGAPIPFHATRLTADMSWELDFWGRIRRGIEAADADAAGQDAAERATVLSLVSDVASGYLQLLELDQEHAIAERTLASRRSTLDLARQRYAAGVISELDVRQFEAQVAAPAVTLAQTERLRAQAEHNLSVLIGETPGRIPRGDSLSQAVRSLIVPDSIPASFLARRPDLAQAERAFAAATARVGLTIASALPTFSITGSYGSQAGSPGDLFAAQTKVYLLQAGVSIPLFSGGQFTNAMAAARARADQARAQYEQAALNALRDANDALVGVRSARDEMAAEATQAEALRHALDLAQLRYSAGIASYLDVLDAERSLFSAELALSQAQLQQLTSAVLLYKALGGGWR